jgi:hypothetical protein
MRRRSTNRCDLWTLPDLWKALADLSTSPWKTLVAFPTVAHRPYWHLSLFFEGLESMKEFV